MAPEADDTSLSVREENPSDVTDSDKNKDKENDKEHDGNDVLPSDNNTSSRSRKKRKLVKRIVIVLSIAILLSAFVIFFRFEIKKGMITIGYKLGIIDHAQYADAYLENVIQKEYQISDSDEWAFEICEKGIKVDDNKNYLLAYDIKDINNDGYQDVIIEYLYFVSFTAGKNSGYADYYSVKAKCFISKADGLLKEVSTSGYLEGVAPSYQKVSSEPNTDDVTKSLYLIKDDSGNIIFAQISAFRDYDHIHMSGGGNGNDWGLTNSCGSDNANESVEEINNSIREHGITQISVHYHNGHISIESSASSGGSLFCRCDDVIEKIELVSVDDTDRTYNGVITFKSVSTDK